MTQIDLEQLATELKDLKRWHKLYHVLKAGLTPLGYWRAKPRGDAKKGYSLGWGRHNRPKPE